MCVRVLVCELEINSGTERKSVDCGAKSLTLVCRSIGRGRKK